MLTCHQTCDPSKLLFEVYSHLGPTSRSGAFDSQFLLTDEPPAEVYADPTYIDLSHMSTNLNMVMVISLLLLKMMNIMVALILWMALGCHSIEPGFLSPQLVPTVFFEYGVVQMEGVTDENGHYDSDTDFDVLTITDEFTPTDDGAPYASLGEMTLEEFGRGYMLYPDESHQHYFGQKYLGDGFWNDKQKGWFSSDLDS